MKVNVNALYVPGMTKNVIEVSDYVKSAGPIIFINHGAYALPKKLFTHTSRRKGDNFRDYGIFVQCVFVHGTFYWSVSMYALFIFICTVMIWPGSTYVPPWRFFPV